jgi:hypothetical protein
VILSIAQQEARYQDGLRRDMKQQDRRRFQNPDVDNGLKGLYALYVWRDEQWLLAGFSRLKPVPARVRRTRKKLHIAPNEVLRYVELDIARRIGAGNVPLLLVKALTPVPKTSRKRAKVPPPSPRVRKVRAEPSHSLCDYGKGLKYIKRCPHRAAWHVAYSSAHGTRVLKCRCTRHAWNDRFFPAVARQLVRVVRSKTSKVRGRRIV